MERVLLLAHVDSSGEFSKATREAAHGAATIAGALGADLVVGLIGARSAGAAGTLGVSASSVLAVPSEDFDVPRYASDAAAAEALARASEATVVLAAATSRLSRALPGVAQRVEGRIATHVTGLEVKDGALQAERWYYRQRMKATLTRAQRPWFLVLAAGAFSPSPSTNETVDCRTIEVPSAGAWRTRVVGEESGPSGTQTILPDADLLLVAGAGWTKKQADGAPHVREAEELIRTFLEQSQASLGSSKSLVDQSTEGADVISFMSHLNQVGQTGATPRHAKGLATCCHGEEPHVVGWRFVTERRAVNLDANCGWAQGKADVVYVADAFQVLKELNQLLS